MVRDSGHQKLMHIFFKKKKKKLILILIYILGTGEDKSCQFDNQIYDPSILPIPLPSDGDSQQSIVQPGKTTLVPFWIRGDRIGKFTMKFLFSYQSEVNLVKNR